MKIGVRLTRKTGDERLLAYGNITLDDVFVIGGIRVIRANSGELFVAYPSTKTQKGGYKDICYPISKSLREDIHTKVIAAYEALA